MAYSLKDTENYFKIDGNVIDVGYGMLETVNQITYPSDNAITRSIDGEMTNLPDMEYYTQPSLKVGFKFISIEDYRLLAAILHNKQTFDVTYFDKDFCKIVTHECYVHPDDLHNFFNLGNNIQGLTDFSMTLVATLSDRTKHTVKIGSTTMASDVLWGTSVIVDGTSSNKYTLSVKVDDTTSKTLTYKGGQRITVYENIVLTKTA